MPTARSVARAWRERLVTKRLPEALGEATALLARSVADAAPVDTEALRDSVRSTRVRRSPGRLSSAVVVSSDHALHVEYGTQDMAPEPFFRPGIRRALSRAVALLRRAR